MNTEIEKGIDTMRYVVMSDYFGFPITFCSSIREAMKEFNLMTKSINATKGTNYLTCEEMGISTEEEFLNKMGNTDKIRCITLEEYIDLAF